MKYTESQLDAIEASGGTLLISAAAGSGKTSTLTKRIIDRIINKGQDLSRLLIVTFTRAAAADLKSKISKALSDAIAEHPGSTHLQRQLVRLGNAHISTIDSFFSEPIRANFEKLNLPASIRLADDAELSPIREKLMRAALDSFFDQCEEFQNSTLSDVGYRDNYTDLLGILTAARDNSKLIPTLISIYQKLITSPDGVEQLKKHSERMYRCAKTDFFNTEEGRIVLSELKLITEYAAGTFEKCCKDMVDDPLLKEKYLPCFSENTTMCHLLLHALESKDYVTIRTAYRSFNPVSTPQISKNDKTEMSEFYRKLRSEKLNKGIKAAAEKYLSLSLEEICEQYKSASVLCDLLYRILLHFESDYNSEKLQKGLCEFSDMPRMMLRLLLDSDGNPTEYANKLSEEYDEIYIDEYQDVNEIQDTIFALIGKDHRFMVGDIKQSIYGFREAEPSIFANYRKQFPLYKKEGSLSKSCGSTIFMSENFRCDANIVDFTNIICSDVFSAFAESIGYTAQDNLKFSKTVSEGYVSPKITVNLIQPADKEAVSEQDNDTGLDYDSSESNNSPIQIAKSLQDEAIITANEIAELLKNGKNADNTPIRGKDIAVLVRGHSYSKPLIEAFNRLNIKYALSSNGELFDSEDMKLLVDLLSVINNPREDISLCRLVTADHNGFKPDFSFKETVMIRKNADKSRSLFDAIILYGEKGEDAELSQRCRVFVDSIEKIRLLASKMSADKLLRALSANERYAPLTNTYAFTYLYDSACKYVRTFWNGLYGFIKYFKALMEKSSSGAEPKKGDSDSVTILTIHQSKGLEFNVCFLFALGKQFNTSDTKEAIVFSKEFGVSMKLPPSKSKQENVFESIRTRYTDNPIRAAADLNLRLKNIQEEARIFYVALTRAKERMYLSATVNKQVYALFDELKLCQSIPYEVRNSRNYIRWVLLSLAHDHSQKNCYKLNVYTKGTSSLCSPLPTGIENSDSINNFTPEEQLLASMLSESSQDSEKAKILSTIPAKVAASKVSPNMLDKCVFMPIPTADLFSEIGDEVSDIDSDTENHIKHRIDLLRSQKSSFDDLLEVNKRPTAAEKGSATHLFLQFCDYGNLAEHGIDQEIERLISQRFISKRTAEIIHKKQLSGFIESQLFKEITTAKKIYREFRFGLFKNADEFTENPEIKEITAGKKIYVQGSVDLIIETQESNIILCDYKTDRISHEEMNDPELLLNNMREKHGRQLKEYRNAIEQIFSKTPEKVYIFSIPLGKLLEINGV